MDAHYMDIRWKYILAKNRSKNNPSDTTQSSLHSLSDPQTRFCPLPIRANYKPIHIRFIIFQYLSYRMYWPYGQMRLRERASKTCSLHFCYVISRRLNWSNMGSTQDRKSLKLTLGNCIYTVTYISSVRIAVLQSNEQILFSSWVSIDRF